MAALAPKIKNFELIRVGPKAAICCHDNGFQRVNVKLVTLHPDWHPKVSRQNAQWRVENQNKNTRHCRTIFLVEIRVLLSEFGAVRLCETHFRNLRKLDISEDLSQSRVIFSQHHVPFPQKTRAQLLALNFIIF